MQPRVTPPPLAQPGLRVANLVSQVAPCHDIEGLRYRARLTEVRVDRGERQAKLLALSPDQLSELDCRSTGTGGLRARSRPGGTAQVPMRPQNKPTLAR